MGKRLAKTEPPRCQRGGPVVVPAECSAWREASPSTVLAGLMPNMPPALEE